MTSDPTTRSPLSCLGPTCRNLVCNCFKEEVGGVGPVRGDRAWRDAVLWQVVSVAGFGRVEGGGRGCGGGCGGLVVGGGCDGLGSADDCGGLGADGACGLFEDGGIGGRLGDSGDPGQLGNGGT